MIEEECGGNGFWAVLRAGYRADATLVGEPTGLAVVRAGTGGRLGAAPGERTGRALGLHRRQRALRRAGARRRRPPPPRSRGERAAPRRRLRGDLRLAVRHDRGADRRRRLDVVGTGLAGGLDPVRARARDRARRDPAGDRRGRRGGGASGRGWLRGSPRARAYRHDSAGPFPELLQRAHADVLGSPAGISAFTATTDARQVDGALCYGPLAGGLHGADEWVDLASLEQTATVVALTAARWLASERP